MIFEEHIAVNTALKRIKQYYAGSFFFIAPYCGDLNSLPSHFLEYLLVSMLLESIDVCTV